ncbi:MAG TPA: AAA family ATPase [Herpetosiphonaceae bacterium]
MPVTHKELLIVSTTPGLVEALAGYEGLSVVMAQRPDLAIQLLSAARPPQALYVEDTRGTVDDLWEMVRTAQRSNIPVFVGLQSVALVQQDDFSDAGVQVMTARDATSIAAWLGAGLGARPLASAKGQVLIAVAGAKGGIGKTRVVADLAEGLLRRGLRVLVVDGDLSNSGLIPTFRIPSGFASYVQIRSDGAAAWTTDNVRRHIMVHESSGIHFLLGSEQTADPQDLQLPEWLALMQAVRGLHEYDVVLLDTGPEIKKRPYALIAARDGGIVILPAPPGRKERTGVANALQVFQRHTPDLSDRCYLLMMEPERSVIVGVDDVAPRFGELFPKTRILGTMPRAAKQVSIADEDQDRYISPLDVMPHSPFSRAVHELVEVLCQELGLNPRKPMPKSSLWHRLRGNRPVLTPSGTSAPRQSVEGAAVHL